MSDDERTRTVVISRVHDADLPSEPTEEELRADLLDITSRIRMRQAAECKHDFVDVDPHAAELDCRDCGVPVDPWWYLRQLAHNEDRNVAEVAERVAKYDEWAARANAIIVDREARIAKLTAELNRLQNTEVDGVRLGSRRRHKRA